MRPHVDLVVLREDRLTQWFVDEFLRAAGYKVRPRFQPDLPVSGSAEQAVRLQFADEVQRQRQKPDQRALLVISDGDQLGADGRTQRLLQQLPDGRAALRREERIAVVVPVWEIENWIRYLRGSGYVASRLDEGQKRFTEAEVREAAREAARRWMQPTCPADCPPELQQARDDFARLQLAKR